VEILLWIAAAVLIVAPLVAAGIIFNNRSLLKEQAIWTTRSRTSTD
jgi:hypothetical protein